MTCLLPLLFVLLPSTTPSNPVIVPASDALKAAIAKSHPALAIVKEAWFDGGANKACQKRSKTMCATKVLINAENPMDVRYLCTKTTVAEEEI